MCRELEYQMAPGSREALTEYMEMRKEMPFFANARTVQSPIRVRVRVRVRHALLRHRAHGA